MTFDEDFGKTGFPRDMFRLRFRELEISQKEFAERFGLKLWMVKDQEQGRVTPSPALKTLLVAIELNPALMQRAASIARKRWG